MSLGFPGRSAATEAPGPDDLLPTDDVLWDQGVSTVRLILRNRLKLGSQKKRGLLYTLASPATVNMGSFARLAKATHLLCHVLKRAHVVEMDENSFPDEAKQLEQDIRALNSLPDVEGQTKITGGSPQTAFCYRYELFRLLTPATVEFA